MTENNTSGVARYGINEAAKRHGLRVWRLREAVRKQQIEFYRISWKLEFTDAAVERFIESMRQEPVNDGPKA